MTGVPVGSAVQRSSRLRIALGVLLLAAVLATLAARLPLALLAPPADGVALDHAPAPGFRLTDPAGRPVALSDLRGKAVVLTFLYTSCPDICPLTASTISKALGQLNPTDRDRVAAVAITVDPARDTPERLGEFVHAQGLDGVLTYLRGDDATLTGVWRDYDVTVQRDPANGTAGYTVVHTAVTYLIDADGRRDRLFRDEALSADRLAQAIRRILAAPGAAR